MKKIKVTKELLADAVLGRLIQTLNKKARDSLTSTSDEEWDSEISGLRLYLSSLSWKQLQAKYIESLTISVDTLMSAKEESTVEYKVIDY